MQCHLNFKHTSKELKIRIKVSNNVVTLVVM